MLIFKQIKKLPSSYSISIQFDVRNDQTKNHVVLMSFVFVIGPTERAVLASYTMVVLARLHDQCTGANSQSELVIPNWL